MTPEEIAKNRKLACIATYDATPDDVGDIQDALLRSLDALEWLKTEFDAHLSMKAELKLADVKAWGRERDARVALESQLSEVREELEKEQRQRKNCALAVVLAQDVIAGHEAMAAALRKENDRLEKLKHTCTLNLENERYALRRENEELKAGFDAVVKDYDRVNLDREKLRAAIEWAMGGPGSDFRLRRDGEGAYWWRIELRQRAGVTSTEPSETPDEIPDHRGASDEELARLPVLKLPPAKPSETEPKRCWYVSELDGARCDKDDGHGGYHHPVANEPLRAPSGTERNQP